MLTRFRVKFNYVINKAALALANLGVKPIHITVTGLILGIMVPVVAFLTNSVLLVLMLIVLSAFSDVLDGAVARLTRRASIWGAFIDSVSDRVSDISYSLSLLAFKINSILVLLFATTSLFISYLRAKAESLMIKIEGVGIMERAERVITVVAILILLLVLPLPSVIYTVLIITLILNIVTIIQRGVEVWRKVGRDPRHGSSP